MILHVWEELKDDGPEILDVAQNNQLEIHVNCSY